MNTDKHGLESGSPERPAEKPVEKPKRKLSWKMMVLIVIFGLVIVLGSTYIIWLVVAKNRFKKAYEKVQALRDVIEPIAGQEENAPGNGGAHLRDLMGTPGLKDLDDKLSDFRREKNQGGISQAITIWAENHYRWIQSIKKCREFELFTFKRDLNQGFSMPMPELSQIRGFFRVHGHYLKELARRGDYANYQDLVAGLTHLQQRYEDPLLISGLVRMSCHTIYSGNINDSLVHIRDSSVLEWLTKELSFEPIPVDYYQRLFQGEAWMVSVWMESGTAWDMYQALSGFHGTSRSKMQQALTRALFGLCAPYVWQEKANCLEYSLVFVDALEGSYPEFEKWQKLNRQRYAEGLGALLSGILFENHMKAAEERFRTNNKQPCLLAVIRIHKYYLENGELPASLVDIEYYKKNGVPVDPRLGNPLAYKVFPKPFCFRVKELGEDGKDSGVWLEPVLDSATGEYEHRPFGWSIERNASGVKAEENIFGVDYYLLDPKPAKPPVPPAPPASEAPVKEPGRKKK
ncbi:hypothetical protein ACFL4W_00180 [Planctomycetota bacterium]